MPPRQDRRRRVLHPVDIAAVRDRRVTRPRHRESPVGMAGASVRSIRRGEPEVPIAHRLARTLVVGAVAVAVCAPALPAFADPSGYHQVVFDGTSVSVPQSWPVVTLADHPGACVRYDTATAY